MHNIIVIIVLEYCILNLYMKNSVNKYLKRIYIRKIGKNSI